MMETDWTKVIPGGTFEGSIEFLNSLSWDIRLDSQGGKWRALSGEHILAAASTKEELEAFILGMTIGLAVLPGSMLDEIRKLVAE